MTKELEEIIVKMNNFSKKYNCKIEVSTYERKYIKNNKTEYTYRLEAIKPKEVIAKA